MSDRSLKKVLWIIYNATPAYIDLHVPSSRDVIDLYYCQLSSYTKHYTYYLFSIITYTRILLAVYKARYTI